MIGQFNMNNITLLKRMGYEVDVACDFNDTSYWPSERIALFRDELSHIGVETFQLDFSRNPLKINRHIASCREAMGLIKRRQYSFIHTHTPVASAIVRIAAHKTKTRVIYTAHGFHFYSGAPLLNWVLYYPIEKWLSRYTDVLITINQEDYNRASKHFNIPMISYVPGVGVDTAKFAPNQSRRELLRKELGLSDDSIMLLSVGELNNNKNHISVIRALQGLPYMYVIVGNGENKDELELVAHQCGVNLYLAGFRNNVADYYNAADVYVLPSIREGLNVSLMEAMASGLAVACSNIRGNVDLIDRPLFNPQIIEEIRTSIETAIETRLELGKINLVKIKSFDLETVEKITTEIYKTMDDMDMRD